jgi:exopolysaccharide production protein ExoZ
LLPLLLLGSNRIPYIVPLVMIVSVIIGVWFAFVAFNVAETLASQWYIYINPLNQLFLFLGGVAIGGVNTERWRKNVINIAIITIVISSSIFYITPAAGDQVNIISGFNRVILSFCCFSICGGFYLLKFSSDSLLSKAFIFFGKGCYSIYLLHPLVGVIVISLTKRIGLTIYFGYSLSVLLTLFVSWLTFNYLEKPMMAMGATFARSISSGGDHQPIKA